jgi:anti-anti-sigma factor
MNLPSEIFGDVIVVHTPEELNADNADSLTTYLAQLERRNVVLDLDSTEAIDSEGLTALLDARDQLITMEGDIKISTSNHSNRKILELTRLDQQLDVFDSVIDAVKSFR